MRRILKTLTIILLSILGLFAISVVCARIYYNDHRIKVLLEDIAGNAANSRVEIGSFDISGWLTIELTAMDFINGSNDSVWLHLDKIETGINPSELIFRRLHVKFLNLEKININYSQLPDFPPAIVGQDKTEEADGFPIGLIVDDFTINGLSISGPEAEITANLKFTDICFLGSDEFSGSYNIQTEKGVLLYLSDEIEVKSKIDIAASGYISSTEKALQNINLTMADILVVVGDSFNIESVSLDLATTSNLIKKQILIDSLVLEMENEELLAFGGTIELGESPKLSLHSAKRKWEMSEINSFLSKINIPMELNGAVSLSEFNCVVSPTYMAYDFTIGISDLDINYDNFFGLVGINGNIYSDGGIDQIIFGSSLLADSAWSRIDGEERINLGGISSAIEAEISDEEKNINISAGVSDFLGGNFDLSAFSENFKIDGELIIENLDLAEISAISAVDNDTTMFGLFDLNIKIAGVPDSLNTEISASLEEFIFKIENDSLYIPRQDITLSATTVLRDSLIKTEINFDISEGFSGAGGVIFPITANGNDSVIVSYNLLIDNSILPSYLPGAISTAIGEIELSGTSAIEGRFTSPVDTLAFTGYSKLHIEPTSIVMDEFQSMLYNLVNVSELRITKKRISLFSDSNIEDLYNDYYSDLDLSGMTLEGEIISLSDTVWRVTGLTLSIPSLKSSLTIMGDLGYSSGEPFSKMNIHFDFNSEEPLEIYEDLLISGKLSANIKTFSDQEYLDFSGDLKVGDMHIESPGLFMIRAINGAVPFGGKLNLLDSIFVNTGRRPEIAGSQYQRGRLIEIASKTVGHVTIDLIEANPIYIHNSEFDAVFKDGILNLPYMTGELLGGNFYGGLRADLQNVNILREIPNYDDVRYNFDMELAGLDFNQLIMGMGPFKEKAGFGADAHFWGKGIIAPGEDYSVAGSFNISEMSPEVASRVLDVIDPENTNPNVAQTKKLLNNKLLGFIDISYKPTSFSFELKHGALYPRLYMDQPFFADVIPLIRIPMPIEYGRIPVKSLINSIKEETW